MLQLKLPLCVFSLCLFFTGCGLAPNQASTDALPAKPTTPTWQHSPETRTKIAQGKTRYITLDHGFNSIAARLYAIHNAQQHLDLQYYIWQDDAIGHLMLSALLSAADRGVKVRLLIDDQNGTALDPHLKALAVHPNIQIRIFNAYRLRHFRVYDYLFRFKQINHRMHNKLLIADASLAITGGRNISREYFDASNEYQFSDLDVMFYGQAVDAANHSFIEFWNHNRSYSTAQLLGKGSSQDLNQLRKDFAAQLPKQAKIRQQLNLAEQKISAEFQRLAQGWAQAYFVADPAAKINAQASEQQLLYRQMQQHMGQPQKVMDIVSAYFVPTQQGVEYLDQLVQQGVKVRVLTNSYLANDVPIVHAFYQKYRQDLLKKGIQLYEFKPYIERPQRTWYEVMTGNIIPAKSKSASRLHAKFFAIDQKVYIGSFNFDPRSAQLNTEVGLIIESDVLQNQIQQRLTQDLAAIAYELRLDANGQIIWVEQRSNGQQRVHHTEPETTKFQRLMFKAIAYTPFEWMM